MRPDPRFVLQPGVEDSEVLHGQRVDLVSYTRSRGAFEAAAASARIPNVYADQKNSPRSIWGV